MLFMHRERIICAMNTAVERPYAGLSRAPILLRARVRLRGLALQLTADDGGILWTQGRPLRAQERECVCVCESVCDIRENIGIDRFHCTHTSMPWYQQNSSGSVVQTTTGLSRFQSFFERGEPPSVDSRLSTR